MDKSTMTKLTDLLNTKYDVSRYAIKRIQHLFEQFDHVVEGQDFKMNYHRFLASKDGKGVGGNKGYNKRNIDQSYDYSHWDITDNQYAEFKSSGLFDLMMSLLNDLMDLCESKTEEEGERTNINELVFSVTVANNMIDFNITLLANLIHSATKG